jgi:hypothetical protein
VEETPGRTLPHAMEETPGRTLAHAMEETPGTTLAHTMEETPGTTLPHAVEETPGRTLAHAMEETPGTTLAHAMEETPGTTLPHTMEETPGTTLAHAMEETPGRTLAHAMEETPGRTPAHAFKETPGTTFAHPRVGTMPSHSQSKSRCEIGRGAPPAAATRGDSSTHPPYFFTPKRLPAESREFVVDPPVFFVAHRTPQPGNIACTHRKKVDLAQECERCERHPLREPHLHTLLPAQLGWELSSAPPLVCIEIAFSAKKVPRSPCSSQQWRMGDAATAQR